MESIRTLVALRLDLIEFHFSKAWGQKFGLHSLCFQGAFSSPTREKKVVIGTLENPPNILIAF